MGIGLVGVGRTSLRDCEPDDVFSCDGDDSVSGNVDVGVVSSGCQWRLGLLNIAVPPFKVAGWWASDAKHQDVKEGHCTQLVRRTWCLLYNTPVPEPPL